MLLLSRHATQKPKEWFWSSGLLSLLLIILMLAPTLAPQYFPFLNPLKIDTDPENMLSTDEPVRVFHNKSKAEFGLNDIVVVGIVNNNSSHGVFNVNSLQEIYNITEYAKTLTWQKDNKKHGVIRADIIAPSTVDNIEQAGLGTVKFEWLMNQPPETEEAAQAIAKKAKHIPFLDNTLISNDAKALALYIPIQSKSDSYDIAEKIREKIQEFKSGNTYYITGLPIAQDQFGVEMFKQMAISAPLAMLLIFMLMLFFFRNINLIIAPIIVAILSVIFTMGLLIVTGHTVHIMSSMIPIFIMPIAVLDAVHILSDFFERYPKIQDRYKTIEHIMEELSKPMLFTTLTTCAGFGSLALTPIPPVQVFGVFIALGVFFAWILTVTLVPGYIMLMSEQSLKGFGGNTNSDENSFLASFLHRTGRFSYKHSKFILLITLLICGVAGYGISLIRINDNPVKWFEKEHDIRISDRALNEKFAGTYMAYLTFTSKKEITDIHLTENDIKKLPQIIQKKLYSHLNSPFSVLRKFIITEQNNSKTDEIWDAWDLALHTLEQRQQQTEVFKQPKLLNYISDLQLYLLNTGLVGKINALTDIVKTVHRELFLGKNEAYRIPDSSAAVAQTLITYQSSHRPQDLWHFVTPDYRKINLWIQLKSGDNKDMQSLIQAVNNYIAKNPPPIELKHNWFGLTYINVIWQDKMVTGMLKAFAGSFIVVLFMMMFLFRSVLWGVLSMIPLAVTISLIYGIIGLIGKDYDMPIAVLSALSLGLAIDYAIHFLARSRYFYTRYNNWHDTLEHVFGEPSRAIFRNVIVIGVGFLPLLAAPLIPYQTVGFFISAILVIAGAASLLILPSLITLFDSLLFPKKDKTNENKIEFN